MPARGCQYAFVTSEKVRNSTCYNHWQWEREENTYTVCRRNGQIWDFFPGKRVHLPRPVRQRVTISWYLEGVRGARCCRIKSWYQQRKKQKREGSLWLQTHRILPLPGQLGMHSPGLHFTTRTRHLGLTFTPASSLQPGLKGCRISLSLGPKNISYFIFYMLLLFKHASTTCYCFLLEIKYFITEKYHSL